MPSSSDTGLISNLRGGTSVLKLGENYSPEPVGGHAVADSTTLPTTGSGELVGAAGRVWDRAGAAHILGRLKYT